MTNWAIIAKGKYINLHLHLRNIFSSLIDSSYTWNVLTSVTLSSLSVESCLILECYIFFLQCTFLIPTAANGNWMLLQSDHINVHEQLLSDHCDEERKQRIKLWLWKKIYVISEDPMWKAVSGFSIYKMFSKIVLTIKWKLCRSFKVQHILARISELLENLFPHYEVGFCSVSFNVYKLMSNVNSWISLFILTVISVNRKHVLLSSMLL